MRKIWCLAAVTLAAGTVSMAPAQALPTASAAESLLPLQTQTLVMMTDNSDLHAVAGRINQMMGAEDSSPTVMDFVESSFLDGVLNENGEVNLPLGITVFSTMGDPSVGFGSNF